MFNQIQKSTSFGRGSLPGYRISDKEIAAEIGVSRTPVREALNRLTEQGLVDTRPSRGFWVKTFSRKEVKDLYVLRDSLEFLAVSLTVREMDDRKGEKLKKLLEIYPSLIKSQNLARLNDEDDKFHDLIACYSDNSVLYEAFKNLLGKIRIARRYDRLGPRSFQKTYDEHREILSYMLKGEMAEARRSMSMHIMNSMKIVLKTLPT